MDNTSFAGLTRLAPGEPLSTDGYSFQNENPNIIDHYLEIGAVGHRHDGHAALADPTDDPVVAAVAGGGAILADTVVFATYTILDADGGETRPATAQSVTTDAALPAPDQGPAIALDTTAGSLLTNTYLYALTFTDGNGGETTLGPSSQIQRPPGPANARVQVSGLTALLTAAGAAGWRLWRSVGGGRYGFLAAGATDTYTDDGAASLDCTMTPPSRNTTNGVNQVTVTVPNTQPAGTAQFRVYLSLDGSFASPSLAGTFPIADAGTPQAFTTIDLADGSPPAVSRSVPGANKINALTDITNLRWRDAVADLAALPTVGNTRGDVRVTLDDLAPHVWDETIPDWSPLSGGGGGGSGQWLAAVANAAALPSSGNTRGDVRETLDDLAVHTWDETIPAWVSLVDAPEAWSALHLHDPAVDGGVSIKFQNYGAYAGVAGTPASPTPGRYRSPDKIVRLRGTVYAPTYSGTYSPSDGPIIAHLPSGYRPASNVSCLAWCQTAAEGKVLVIVMVDTAGLVTIGSYIDNGVFSGGFDSGSKFALDSIEFPAA